MDPRGWADGKFEVPNIETLLTNTETEIAECVGDLLALANRIPGIEHCETADEAIASIIENCSLEKNACYDFEPESMARFLRRVIKALEQNDGHEESLFRMLLEFSAAEGFIFPFRSLKANAQAALVLSLNTVADEGEQVNRALWGEVKTLFRNYFSNCLCQLQITDCSIVADEKRLDYLQKLNVLLEDKDLWEQYRTLRSYQLSSYLNEALGANGDVPAGGLKVLASKFSVICQTVAAMVNADFRLFSTGLLQAVVSPFEALNCLYLQKLSDILESILESTCSDISIEERQQQQPVPVPAALLNRTGSDRDIVDPLILRPGGSVSKSQNKTVAAALLTAAAQRDARVSPATPEKKADAGALEALFQPMVAMVIDIAALEHHLNIVAASSVLCSLPPSQSAPGPSSGGTREKKKGVLKSTSSSDVSESSETAQSTQQSAAAAQGTDSGNLSMDSSWRSEPAPEVVERPSFYDRPKWPWRDVLKKYTPFMCKMVNSQIEKAATICRKQLSELPNTSTIPSSGVIVDICPSLFGNRLEYPRVVIKAASDFMLCLDGLLPVAKAAGNHALAPVMTSFVSTASTHLREIHGDLSKLLDSIPEKREMKWILYVIATAAVVRNHLFHYDSILGEDKDSKNNFLLLYRQYCEMVDLASQQFTDMQNTMMATSLLHDAESNNWSDSKEFYEDERCSFTVQMWNLHMQGVQHDLWSTCPPKISQAVFGSILQYTLELLTQRYCSVSPSYRRVKQFRMDILSILFCAYELLFPAATVPSSIFDIPSCDANPVPQRHLPPQQQQQFCTIHSACSRLLAALAVVASPLDALYAAFKHGHHRRAKKKHRHSRAHQASSDPAAGAAGGGADALPPAGPCSWMSWIHGALHNRADKSYEMMQTTVALHLHLKLLAEQPEPNWGLILQALIMKDFTLPTILLTHDAQQQKPWQLSATRQSDPHPVAEPSPAACSAAVFCSGAGTCLASAAAASGAAVGIFRPVLHVISSCSPSYDEGLTRVLLPVIDRSNSWECFDVKTCIETAGKTPWMCAVLELMEPYAELVLSDVLACLATCTLGSSGRGPALDELLEELPCGCPLTSKSREHRSPDSWDPMAILLESITGHMRRVPASVDVLLCSLQEELLQRETKMAHGSIHVQMVAVCLVTRFRDEQFVMRVAGGAVSPVVRQHLRELSETLGFTLFGTIHDSNPEAINAYMKLADNPSLQQLVNDAIHALQAAPWHAHEEELDCSSACQDFIGYKMAILANGVLESPHGELYLRQIHNLLVNNRLWLDMCLGITSPLPQRTAAPQQQQFTTSTEAKNWGRFNPLEHFERIGSDVFCQEAIGEFPLEWQKLLQSDLGLTEANLTTLLHHRHEFQDGAHLEDKERKPVDVLKSKFDKGWADTAGQ